MQARRALIVKLLYLSLLFCYENPSIIEVYIYFKACITKHVNTNKSSSNSDPNNRKRKKAAFSNNCSK